MGRIAEVFGGVRNAGSLISLPISTDWGQALSPSGGPYQTYARAYGANEIVYSAVSLLGTSASEPHIVGRRWRRAAPGTGRAGQAAMEAEMKRRIDAWQALGIRNRAGHRMLDAMLISNGFIEQIVNHPLVTLVNNPNPVTSRAHFWGPLTMDRMLGGNAYALKGRTPLGNTAELWRLRPDRVKIIPDQTDGYRFLYTVGNEKVEYPRADVLHFKDAKNPYDEYYGMPPLMAALPRVDIDSFMRNVLRVFYERGGVGPGSVLSIEGRLNDEAKNEIRQRFRQRYGGTAGWQEIMVTDQKATYTRLGLERGLRDFLPREVDAQTEARIAMCFGIPGSILGLLIGYESSSYANKRQDWQVLWDVVMTPFLSDLADTMNLSLTPEFAGVDELLFDLSDIRALQEDENALQDRARKNFLAGGWSLEEFRSATGVDPAGEGTYFVPFNMQPTTRANLTSAPARPATAVPGAPRDFWAEVETAPTWDDVPRLTAGVNTEDAPRVGRRPRLMDPDARALWERGMALLERYPAMTHEQVASRLSIGLSTWRAYRTTFGVES